ncbi:epidermal growth factor receptor kinase substrate 8-like protein 3 isoform X2 [Pelobates fuscus]|uniref:epidermal growth factor receptor kinase substrate 8-like protein 3 isoform X2 n=1 Tax=Pelobates fuscus TaxID=191477 RepID=UPI002FE437CC
MDDYLNSTDVLAHRGEPSRHSMRPSAKSIYEQRKQYAQSLTMAENSLEHRVEHLLTCDLDNEVRSVEDCMKRLRSLDAEGRIWGQDLMLEVKNGNLQLNDLETRDSLESVPLRNVLSCRSVMGGPTYNSVLTVTIQDPQKSTVFIFQCDEQPANVLHSLLEKALKQEKSNTEGNNSRNNVPRPPQLPRTTFAPSPPQSVGRESPKSNRMEMTTESPLESPLQQRRYSPENFQGFNAPPSFQAPPVNQVADMQRDIDVLNHVLQDIELFVGKLNNPKNKKKGKSVIPESEFIDCLQKIKYAFNLLGKAQSQMQQPTAPDLVHTMFTILPLVLSKCPRKNVAPTVVSPLLTQKALTLLSSCVTDKERRFWEDLGDAWKRTRADWPNSKMVPQYIPTFSDGWIPPEIPSLSEQPQIQSGIQTPPINRYNQSHTLQVLYDFDARNSRELSVQKGDNVKVLDQSRQWWLVEDYQRQKGYIPSNILDTGEVGQVFGDGVPLHQDSSREEVTAWLKEKGFSNITVRCLGVLRGDQLLALSREELKTVCPEEGGRVFTQLNALHGGRGM